MKRPGLTECQNVPGFTGNLESSKSSMKQKALAAGLGTAGSWRQRPCLLTLPPVGFTAPEHFWYDI